MNSPKNHKNTKQCPFCAEEILTNAKKCKHCHEYLFDDNNDNKLTENKWNPSLAAVLSFVIPGLGQIYKGQIGKGLILLLITSFGYALFILPGIVIHLFVIFDAYGKGPERNNANTSN